MFVAQSGNLWMQLLAFAKEEDIGIRTFGGSGNEAMITIEDYMECFELDDMTKTVVMYSESIKMAGASAAASHTGSMASNINIFETACKQAGVIQAQ